MGWLRSVGSIKLQVSFAEYRLFYRALLQKRPTILSIILTKATPYGVSCESSFGVVRVERVGKLLVQTHCNTLQHTATHCNALEHTATRCNTLQHTATLCNTLQHTATHCNTLQLTATLCNTLQHSATHCNALQHTATHRGNFLVQSCLFSVCSTSSKDTG